MKKTLILMALLGGFAAAAEPDVYTWNGSEGSSFYTPANWTLNGESVTELPGLADGTEDDHRWGTGWRITDKENEHVFVIGENATVDVQGTPVYYNASTFKLGQDSTLKTSWDFQINRMEVSTGSYLTGGAGMQIATFSVTEGQNYTWTNTFSSAQISTVEISKNASLTTVKGSAMSVSNLNLVRGDWGNNAGAALHVLDSATAATGTFIGDAGNLTVDGNFSAGALSMDGTKTSLKVGGNLTASSITLSSGWSEGHASVTVQGETHVNNQVQLNEVNVMTLNGKLTVGTSVSLGSSSSLALSKAAGSTVGSYIAMEANSSISLTQGTVLTVTNTGNSGGVWMKANSAITLDSTSSLTSGNLTVTGGSMKNLDSIKEAHFGGGNGNRHVTLTGSTLTIGGDATTVDDYILDGGLLKVETGTATTVEASLSATTSLSVSDSTSVKFAEGNKNIGVLTLGSGATVTLGSESNHAYTLTTSGLVVSGASGKVNADLVVSSGTMDFTAGHALTMGCGVTIGNDVVVKLDSTMIDAIMGGQYFDIIEGVDASAVTLGNVSFESNDNRDLTGLGLALQTIDAGNGKVNIRVAPEPATATLSLLALAGLCARRRR